MEEDSHRPQVVIYEEEVEVATREDLVPSLAEGDGARGAPGATHEEEEAIGHGVH